MLKKARESSGVSLEYISEQTLIPVARLSALETEDFDRVGGSAYVVGYARNAAQTIGVDPKPIVDGFTALLNQEESRIFSANQAVSSAAQQPGIKNLQKMIVGVGIALLLVVILMIYLGLRGSGGESTTSGSAISDSSINDLASPHLIETEVPEDQSKIQQSSDRDNGSDGRGVDEMDSNTSELSNVKPGETVIDIDQAEPEEVDQKAEVALSDLYADDASVEESQPDSEAVEANESAIETQLTFEKADSGTIDIYFADECWVQITDSSGDRLVARVAQAGDHLTVSGQPPFDVMLGNARGATIEYDGTEFPFTPKKSKRTLRLTLGE